MVIFDAAEWGACSLLEWSVASDAADVDTDDVRCVLGCVDAAVAATGTDDTAAAEFDVALLDDVNGGRADNSALASACDAASSEVVEV